ncbi:MAG TPA: serine/threonine-protein kinase [Polyangiaceae bacterium]
MSTDPDDFPSVRAGDVVAGKYRVERVLGMGGMGVVVAAYHLKLDQRVALKFLLPKAMAAEGVVDRFDREARASARIRSEHVARVVDVGKLPDGSPYMVMEYLDGLDLGAWLERSGPLPVEQAVEFVLQACEAIAEAHSLGIVHRDLKPSNLFCIRTPGGRLSIKVLDFGISKVTGLGNSTGDLAATRTGAVVGSPFYMSPEQMHSARGVDARTDLWALGVILFELLTGRVPFAAETMPELVLRVLGAPAPRPSALRVDVPPGIDDVVVRCLEKDREERFGSVGELALALAPFATPEARTSIDAIAGIAGIGPTAAVPAPLVHAGAVAERARVAPLGPRRSGGTVATWGQTQGKRSRSPSRAVGWVAAGLVAAVVSVAMLLVALRPWRLVPATGDGPGVADAPTVGADARAMTSVAATDGSAREDAPPPAEVVPPSVTDAARPDGGESPVSAGSTNGTATNRPGGPTPPLVSPQPPTVRPDCKPPYFYDARGNRVFKTECLP